MTAGRSADPSPSVAVKVFSAGAAGCVADLATFPLDTAKVRLQVRVTGMQVNKHHQAHSESVLVSQLVRNCFHAGNIC